MNVFHVPRSEGWHRTLGFITGISLALLLVGFIFVSFRVLELAEQSRKAQKVNSRVLSLIEDCTIPKDPPTECARRSAEQTARAVSLISEETQYRIVVALGCETEARDTIAEIEECVRAEMKKIERQRR